MAAKTQPSVDIEALKAASTPVQAEDSMAEAGRKILLGDFIRMLNHEAGSRTGEDIEDVHQMRVATRRMRSAFRLLGQYYKDKPVRPFVGYLRKVAQALGGVRDLDVLIDDLERYQQTLDAKTAKALGATIALLDKKRRKARKRLVALLDSKDYAGFVRSYAKFLTKPGKGAKSLNGDGPSPHQVRHALPVEIHTHLADVRAYDTVLPDAPVETLHALRIEFKRLRYIVDYFQVVLGATSGDYLKGIKAIQDHLGRINDIEVATNTLMDIADDDRLDAAQAAALDAYLEAIKVEGEALITGFPEVWERFNTRTMQGKLASALLVLR